jgi:L-alanine-DL-glutamate epimerase-like enolase superfamily enzyme
VTTFFARHRAALIETIACLADLAAWAESHRAEIDRHPAAWCAIELALLDLLGKERGVPVETLLGLPAAAQSFRYSAVVGASDGAAFRATVERYRDLGFSDFKLKLCGDPERDRDNLDWMRRADIPTSRLRVDANNLWSTTAEAEHYLAALESPIFAVEEPLRANQYAALAALAAARRVAVILDESCLRAEHIAALCGLGERWIINVRVSKMGGLLRSMQVVDAARRRGLPIIVGAQVGETSLLTRAALAIATHAGDALLAQEGAFGTLLLTADVCDPPLMFGPGGLLRLCAPHANGFGIAVARAVPFLRPL